MYGHIVYSLSYSFLQALICHGKEDVYGSLVKTSAKGGLTEKSATIDLYIPTIFRDE